MRYILYPMRKECCACCDAAHGCGILKQDWLAGAEFVGDETFDGMAVRRWNKKGLQPNYYLETADDDRRPVQVDQVPNDIMTFETSTFDTRVPAGIFDFPDWCDSGIRSLVKLMKMKHEEIVNNIVL